MKIFKCTNANNIWPITVTEMLLKVVPNTYIQHNQHKTIEYTCYTTWKMYIRFMVYIKNCALQIYMILMEEYDVYKSLHFIFFKTKKIHVIMLCKESFNSYGQQFNQYQHNKQSLLTSNHLIQKRPQHYIWCWKSRSWFDTGTKILYELELI